MNKYYDVSLVREVMTGPVPSLNTPFNKDGSLDWANMGKLLDFQIANGAKSILITQGDSCLSNLSDQETAELVKFVVETVTKRAMVIGGGRHFDATFRAMYEILGLGQRWRRTPYTSYTDEQMEELRAFMQSLKLI